MVPWNIAHHVYVSVRLWWLVRILSQIHLFCFFTDVTQHEWLHCGIQSATLCEWHIGFPSDWDDSEKSTRKTYYAGEGLIMFSTVLLSWTRIFTLAGVPDLLLVWMNVRLLTSGGVAWSYLYLIPTHPLFCRRLWTTRGSKKITWWNVEGNQHSFCTLFTSSVLIISPHFLLVITLIFITFLLCSLFTFHIQLHTTIM